MNYEIIIDTKPNSFLKKLAKTTPKDFNKIDGFLKRLESIQEPLKLPNCTKLVAFSDNRYRWRLGNHKIIAIIAKNQIQIIHIAKRDEKNLRLNHLDKLF